MFQGEGTASIKALWQKAWAGQETKRRPVQFSDEWNVRLEKWALLGSPQGSFSKGHYFEHTSQIHHERHSVEAGPGFPGDLTVA